MEKPAEAWEQKKVGRQSTINHHVIWDCESSLYDSFELKSFQKQLDSAISSRTLSMPHLSGRHDPPPLNKRPASKISRSFRKLIRSILRPKSSRITNKLDEINFGGELIGYEEGFYVVYDCALSSTIPEFNGVSPEIRSLVKRSASQRFTAPTS